MGKFDPKLPFRTAAADQSIRPAGLALKSEASTTAEAIIAFCREQLAHFEAPQP
jgi:hypothetical protein